MAKAPLKRIPRLSLRSKRKEKPQIDSQFQGNTRMETKRMVIALHVPIDYTETRKTPLIIINNVEYCHLEY